MSADLLDDVRREKIMKKQPQVTEATKKKLIDAFWDLYKVKSIEKITIKEITAKGGYNRSTFYKYFIDVYDILECIEDTLIAYIKENIIFDTINCGEDETVIHKIVSIYEEKGEYINVLLSKKGSPVFVKKLKLVFKPALYTAFGISIDDDVYYGIIFEFSISAILGAFSYWYSNKDLFSEDEFIVLVRSMLSNGVLEKLKSNIGKES